MGDDFMVNIESRTVPYRANEPFPDNLMNLSPELLGIRKVLWLDVVDSKPQPDKKADSLRGFKCPEGGITAPLTGDKKGKAADEAKPPVWAQSYPGEMVCSVRVVHFQFKWKGLQTIMEKNISTMNRTMALDIERKLVRRAAEWFKLTEADGEAIQRRLLEAMLAGAGQIPPSSDAAPDDEPEEPIIVPAELAQAAEGDDD
jgi:hypothetical protein